jgi:superfamily II DNA or RNA helicase
MDNGYKEGIDLFDIKYIHIFEPSLNNSDLKQVIGRGTRTCGQKGLKFIPGIGWPLYVYIYDLIIQE